MTRFHSLIEIPSWALIEIPTIVEAKVTHSLIEIPSQALIEIPTLVGSELSSVRQRNSDCVQSYRNYDLQQAPKFRPEVLQKFRAEFRPSDGLIEIPRQRTEIPTEVFRNPDRNSDRGLLEISPEPQSYRNSELGSYRNSDYSGTGRDPELSSVRQRKPDCVQSYRDYVLQLAPKFRPEVLQNNARNSDRQTVLQKSQGSVPKFRPKSYRNPDRNSDRGLIEISPEPQSYRNSEQGSYRNSDYSGTGRASTSPQSYRNSELGSCRNSDYSGTGRASTNPQSYRNSEPGSYRNSDYSGLGEGLHPRLQGIQHRKYWGKCWEGRTYAQFDSMLEPSWLRIVDNTF